ncbi:MAG: nitrilase-related carbon-nitrogen hydrolase, partial [Bdellovibrionota bacterium]
MTTVAALQTSFTTDSKSNVHKVTELVLSAAKKGANVILLPELFENVYFCTEEKDDYFSLARPVDGHPTIEHFRKMARDLAVVLPVSFFKQDGPHYYNSLAMIDADGTVMGVYRKSHIPDGPGYEEKYYFRPGNTGFKVWPTRYGKIGVGICWDQWFPEAARSMMLMGADLLMYPTAIGTEPEEPGLDTKDPWQRAMIGHAVSNVV